MESNSANQLAPMPPISGSSPGYPSLNKSRGCSRMENNELGGVDDLGNFEENNELKVDNG